MICHPHSFQIGYVYNVVMWKRVKSIMLLPKHHGTQTLEAKLNYSKTLLTNPSFCVVTDSKFTRQVIYMNKDGGSES